MEGDRTAAQRVYSSPAGRWVFFGLLAGFVGAVGARLLGVAVPGAALLVLGGLCLGVCALGNFHAPSGVFGRTLLRGPAGRAQVALTFDDGPSPVGTPQVLAALARHGVRATFFVIGERAARYPALVRALVDAGHQVENHSHRHGWFTAFMPRGRLAAELRAAQDVIAQATGRAPRWFRPPIGILSPPVVAAAQRVGLGLCGWSAKARDGWASTDVNAAVARLERGLAPGAILLLHDAPEFAALEDAGTRAETDAGAGGVSGADGKPVGRPAPIAPAILDRLLPILKARGLAAVTLDELLG